MKCRFCGNPLTHEFVDLGLSPPSNSYLTAEQLNGPEAKYPLKAFVCDRCFLVQIDEYKRAADIFDGDYAYFSSYSKTWLDHAAAYVDMASTRFGLTPDSRVIEIASNDGYLLQYFKQKNIPVLGIEPTVGTARVARDKGIETLTKFFGSEFAQGLADRGIQGDLVLGNNVLAHVPDINDFVEGLKIVLKVDGVITMEFPHLLQLVENNQFDTIYHEHFSYLSLGTTRQIFAAHGLTVFDVDEIPTHGGSLRIYARHSENAGEVSSNVERVLANERQHGMTRVDYYLGFQEKAERARKDLIAFLDEAERSGKSVAACGAAAKGNTLLNYCGVTSGQISFVVDASPHKQGLFMPGSRIPIVDESRLRLEKPDYVLVLPWNIKNEITEQLQYIREWGGQFVTAIPELRIFSYTK